MTITIYGVPKSRAIRNIWLCEETRQPYEVVPILQRSPEAEDPGYRAVNPMGQIPAMKDGDTVLTESLAINLYLARKAGGPIGPADLKEEGEIAMWTLFAATQLEPDAMVTLYNRVMNPENERDEAAVGKAVEALQRPLAMLEAAWSRGWLVGGRFTAADLNVATVIFYLRGAPEALERFPAIKARWAEIQQRPAFVRTMKLREG